MNYQSTIDSMVFEFFNKAVEALLQERKASFAPIATNPRLYTDHFDYIRQSLQYWRGQLTKPINIDFYIFHNQSNAHILLERWQFSYKPQSDAVSDSIGSINMRIQTLIRSLYCFVRLLPGFNQLNACSQRSVISFQIYEPKTTPPDFKYECSRYAFPPTSTSRGIISLSVVFLSPNIVKVRN